jgi:hypothetical protein
MEKLIEFNNSGSLGFRLRYVPEKDVFQFHAGKHGAWEGQLREIWQKMHWDFGIENKEIRMALSEMEKHKHFVADFGIFATFICTFEK